VNCLAEAVLGIRNLGLWVGPRLLLRFDWTCVHVETYYFLFCSENFGVDLFLSFSLRLLPAIIRRPLFCHKWFERTFIKFAHEYLFLTDISAKC